MSLASMSDGEPDLGSMSGSDMPSLYGAYMPTSYDPYGPNPQAANMSVSNTSDPVRVSVVPEQLQLGVNMEIQV